MKDSDTRTEQQPPWWGEFALPVPGMGRWHVGPLELWVQHLAGEWRIAWRSGEEPMQPLVQVQVETGLPVRAPEPDMQVCRFSFSRPDPLLRLVPMLADRPVVVRPETPLSIPGGEETMLFVSTALWVGIHAGQRGSALIEIPSLRPSDTWFGANTRQGELCYASRTLAHLRREDVIARPHRAVTPVRICNHAHDALRLERLSVPVPLLTLHHDRLGNFWTQSLQLERAGRDGDVRMQIGAAGLPHDKTLRQVNVPRQLDDHSSVFRALSRFFG